MDIEGIQFLQVTNKGTRRFKQKFHGVEYDFVPGEPVTMPVEAAAHIFGVGQQDKLPAFHRLGWVTTTQQIEGAMKKLKDIKFEPVKQVYEIATARADRDAAIPGDASTGVSEVKGTTAEF